MPETIKEMTAKYTDAQLEYLAHACKHAALAYGWEGDPKAANSPKLRKKRGWLIVGEPREAYPAPEQSIISLARRGGAVLKETDRRINHFPLRWWVLTEEGILVGLAEYKRQTGRNLMEQAAKAREKDKKLAEREERIVKAIADPFRGISVRVGDGKKRKTRDLGTHIEKALLGHGTATTVEFDRGLLEQLGRRIDAIREAPPRKT